MDEPDSCVLTIAPTDVCAPLQTQETDGSVGGGSTGPPPDSRVTRTPVDQSSSTKGGPYTHGPFTNGTLGEQFGVVTVTDNGGPTIQVTFTGRRNGSAIAGASHQFTRTLAPN